MAVGLGLRVGRRGAAIQQRSDACGRALGQVARHRLGQKLGPCLPLGRRDDARVGVAIGIHEAQRGEAVEPGIGDLFDHLALAVPRNGGIELLHRLRMLAPRGRGRIDHKVELRGDLVDQQVAGGLGKFLQRVRVHQTITFLPARICSSRAFFISSTYCSTSASSVR